MKIALTHGFCWPEVRRGGERLAHELAAALARRGHEITFFTSSWDSPPVRIAGAETVCLRRRKVDDWRHQADFGRRLLPHLIARRLDVVHSLGRFDAIASLRAAKVRRGRLTVFSDIGIPERRWLEAQSRAVARASRRVAARVDVYSCMSLYALEYLRNDYGRADGVVLPGGVSLGRFRPAAERAPTPTILMSGAFMEPQKRLPLLLDALSHIAEREPETRLWLSGPGDPSVLLAAVPDAVRARVELLGLGDIDGQDERYGRAWVTCLPSVTESFGLVLVESLACGTPVVVPSRGAASELANPGQTGELFEPDDARDLAAACLRGFELVRNPTAALACRASVGKYDWDASVAPLAERLYAGGGALRH